MIFSPDSDPLGSVTSEDVLHAVGRATRQLDLIDRLFSALCPGGAPPPESDPELGSAERELAVVFLRYLERRPDVMERIQLQLTCVWTLQRAHAWLDAQTLFLEVAAKLDDSAARLRARARILGQRVRPLLAAAYAAGARMQPADVDLRELLVKPPTLRPRADGGGETRDGLGEGSR